MVRGKIDRNRGAERMANGAKVGFQFFLGQSQLFCHSIQSRIGRGARACDGGVTLTFSVAGIIQEEKCIVRIWITRENCRPVERKRTVAAKREPNSGWYPRAVSRPNVKRRLFAKWQAERNFFACRRQGLGIARIVRPRMINDRMLLEIEQRDEQENAHSDHRHAAK